MSLTMLYSASVLIFADVAQLVEHVLGKNEVSGSIPDIGSSEAPRRLVNRFVHMSSSLGKKENI